MTPMQAAQAVYRQEWCKRGFWDDFKLYSRYGYVVSLPDVFIMGRGVKAGWSQDMIVDPMTTTSDPDCWHVALYAGELVRVFDFMPFYLPFVSFERNNKLKIYGTSTITNKILGHDKVTA